MEGWWLQSKSPCNDLYINIVWKNQRSIKESLLPFNPNVKSFTSPNTLDFHAETHLSISHSMWLLIQCFGIDSFPSVCQPPFSHLTSKLIFHSILHSGGKHSPDLWGISLISIQYGPAKLLPTIGWDITTVKVFLTFQVQCNSFIKRPYFRNEYADMRYIEFDEMKTASPMIKRFEVGGCRRVEITSCMTHHQLPCRWGNSVHRLMPTRGGAITTAPCVETPFASCHENIHCSGSCGWVCVPSKMQRKCVAAWHNGVGALWCYIVFMS